MRGQTFGPHRMRLRIATRFRWSPNAPSRTDQFIAVLLLLMRAKLTEVCARAAGEPPRAAKAPKGGFQPPGGYRGVGTHPLGRWLEGGWKVVGRWLEGGWKGKNPVGRRLEGASINRSPSHPRALAEVHPSHPRAQAEVPRRSAHAALMVVRWSRYECGARRRGDALPR